MLQPWLHDLAIDYSDYGYRKSSTYGLKSDFVLASYVLHPAVNYPQFCFFLGISLLGMVWNDPHMVFYWDCHIKNCAVQRHQRILGWSLVMPSWLFGAVESLWAQNPRGEQFTHTPHTVRWFQKGSKEVHLWAFVVPWISFSTPRWFTLSLCIVVVSISVFFPHLIQGGAP